MSHFENRAPLKPVLGGRALYGALGSLQRSFLSRNITPHKHGLLTKMNARSTVNIYGQVGTVS